MKRILAGSRLATALGAAVLVACLRTGEGFQPLTAPPGNASLESVPTADPTFVGTNTPLPLIPPPDPFFMAAPGFMHKVSVSYKPSTEQHTGKVYAVMPREVNDADARSIMSRLGFNGDPEYRPASVMEQDLFGYGVSTPCFEAKNGGARVEVLVNGAVFYDALEGRENRTAPRSKEEAQRYAESILSEIGLLPKGARGTEVWDDLTVVRYPDLRPDAGEAMRASVILDEDGALLWMYHNLPQIVLVGEYPLYSEKEASDRIAEFGFYVDWEPEAVVFSSATLLYHTATRKDAIVFLVPCYQFHAASGDSACVPLARDEFFLPAEEGWDWTSPAQPQRPGPAVQPDKARQTG